MAINPECVYIQGLDSVAVVLYTQLHGTSYFPFLLPMLKQIYQAFLYPFIDKTSHHLNFKYASTLTSRLLAFHCPALFRHFNRIGFQHDFYIVQWFMTLFAHTLPVPQVAELWTYLFAQKVEYLFFVTIAILMLL